MPEEVPAGGSRSTGISIASDVSYGESGYQVLDVFSPERGVKPDGRELPALLHFHGGAWTRGDKGMLSDASCVLAGLGYVVFNANYRLVKRRRNRWPACWEDARAVLEWVLENGSRYGADPGRIGAIGYSAGGHLAALLGTRPETRERISCVVDFFGPSHLGPGRRRVGQYMLFGKWRPSREVYESASPALLAGPGTPPFLILHGSSDRMVPVEHSQLLHEALLRSGAESRLLLFDGQPHAFVRRNSDGSLPREARTAFEEVMSFLSVHLRPHGRGEMNRNEH